MDSGSYIYVPSSSLPYRHILDEQVNWYAAQAAALKEENQGKTVPSLMFTHIPLLEHKEAYQQGGGIGVWGGFSPSTNRSAIFERAMEVGDVRGIFVGHNHGNSYTGFYTRGDRKIMMGITPQASAKSYEDTDSIMYSRVLRLNEDGNFNTYLHTTDTSKYPDGVFRGEYLNYN